MPDGTKAWDCTPKVAVAVPPLGGRMAGLRLPLLTDDEAFEEHEHPRADLGDPLALHVNGRLADALDQRLQIQPLAEASRSL